MSGLRCGELVDILNCQHQRGVRADTMIICVGTNDYHLASSKSVIQSFREIIVVATKVSSKVILCTIPDSRWKGNHGDYQRNVQARQRINTALLHMQGPMVGIYHMEHLFYGHCGFAKEDGPGWYHKDYVI